MKPILFNTEMVRAILDGHKTVTRRVVKPQPEKSAYSPYECVGERVAFRIGERGCTEQYRPPYRTGDILYVRETWAKQQGVYWHKAGLVLDKEGREPHGTVAPTKWRPSIHMPREAARIFLRVEDVRVERLQEILTDNCLAPSNIQKEGLTKPCVLCIHPDFDCREHIKSGKCDLVSEFINLWNSTIKSADRALYGWDANPWVWVIEFKRMSREEAEKNAKDKN